MGGNAFKSIKICRLDAKDYHNLSSQVILSLAVRSSNTFKKIPSFFTKKDFGDLDILYCGPALPFEEIKETLQAHSFIRNGDVTSYAVPIDDEFFQVDLIKVPSEVFDFALGYFSYNDLGNIMGRIYHRLGFKFGHLGLRFIIRDDKDSSHVLREITITNDFRAALEFVGYDYKRWTLGFNTLEDVFKYAVSIPLANRIIFRLDETNHAARIRDRKRKTYNQFLTWVNDPLNGVSDTEVTDKEKLRSYFLEKAFLLFPDFRKCFIESQILCEKIRAAKEKFNGNLVMELTGLYGEELGRFMKDLIAFKTKEDVSKIDWILKSKDISKEITDFWIRYEKTS